MGGAMGAVSLMPSGMLFAQEPSGREEEEGVSPVEDLMREHGVLRRILLIYREWIKRLASGGSGDVETLSDSNKIVRSFVEDYHEKLEEDYLFPRFGKVGKLVDLADVLVKQHRAGRRLTDTSIGLSNTASLRSAANRRELSLSLAGFISMYEPHSAREDTVLFPAFHELMPMGEYEHMGEVFEEKERQLFGEDGFEKMVDRVASIERKLGIHDLARFTPGT
jgi:hemerythrin-like domain-containing protein